jgi:hypothetical protein
VDIQPIHYVYRWMDLRLSARNSVPRCIGPNAKYRIEPAARADHPETQVRFGRQIPMLDKVWEGFQLIVVIAFFVGALLWKMAPGNPRLAWVRKFKLKDNRTEQQKLRARRSRHIMDGLEMIVMGLVLPPLYLLSTVMAFFSGVNPFILAGTIALSLVLIVIGIRSIVKARA